MINILLEFLNIEEEIKRIIDDTLTALIAENVKAVNIYSFINTVKDIFPEKQFSDKELKEKIISYLTKHQNIKKIIGDIVYLDIKNFDYDELKRTSDNELEKLTKSYVTKKLKNKK